MPAPWLGFLNLAGAVDDHVALRPKLGHMFLQLGQFSPTFLYPNEDMPYVLKTGLIHLFPKLDGLAGDDHHKHLKKFLIVCSTMKPHDVQEDHIYLKAFPRSLEGPTKDWLYYLDPGSIAILWLKLCSDTLAQVM
ncbi:hypothetical protein Lal_00031989 [Lupinus albus]|nr:hypothetical protein Lal_00031989 [Lupinus albus]